jgi:hypothetical protein
LSAFFPQDGIVTISNSYATEAVNYIVCWYRSENAIRETAVVDFNFEHNPDCMIPLTQGPTKLSIGRFSARIDQSLITRTQNVFVFVLEGAFEFQNRLLEQKDALSLTNVSSVDFEALSNDAILMIAELS